MAKARKHDGFGSFGCPRSLSLAEFERRIQAAADRPSAQFARTLQQTVNEVPEGYRRIVRKRDGIR
jgi:hypothetical protein